MSQTPTDRPSGPLTVLDCTLRDGGYYNAWDFQPELVDSYLTAVGAAGVDVVEIGFRSPAKPRFYGPFAYSTDDFLSGLKLPAGVAIGVMVNAADLIDDDVDPADAVDALFQPADRSPVSLVRIAAHLTEVPRCGPYTARLRELGYQVGLNLMQVSRADAAEVTELAALVESWGSVDVLYFADSLGNMTLTEVAAVVEALGAGWNGPLGIHAHDNRARALINTLGAAEMGVGWLDATVLGMGRGAGNVRTDFLLFELSQQGHDRYRPDALLPVVLGGFQELLDEHRWGTNLLYLMSAAYDIHPTYVQAMLSDARYETSDMVGALAALRHLEGHSFSVDRLGQALAGDAGSEQGSWDASGWLEGRDVLILGTGPSAEIHREELTRFIARTRPAVLCLNTGSTINEELITAFVACHPSRLMLESARLATLTRPLVAPNDTVERLLGEGAELAEPLDFGLRVEADTFSIGPNGCVLPTRLAIAYAMAVAVAGGAERILLAGVDGYPAGDPRQDEMLAVLHAYDELDGAVPLLAITPSTYPVPQGSVYAPDL